MPAAAVPLPRHLGPDADFSDVEIPLFFLFQLGGVVGLAGNERAGGEDGGEGLAGVRAEGNCRLRIGDCRFEI